MNTPLVIIPGFMADARVFLPQIIEFGGSRPVLVAPPATADTIERIGEELAPALPERFALLGHGLGSEVAIELCRTRADQVTHMALVAADGLSEQPAEAAAREERIVAARAGRLADAMAAEIPEHVLAPGPKRAGILDLVLGMGLALGPDVYVRQSRALQHRPDQQETLRRARIPTLVLAGRADRLAPLRRQELLATLMPRGRLCVIEDAGHLPQIEQPEAVNAALHALLAGSTPGEPPGA